MDAKFIKLVESNNISRVRYCISDELIFDPRGNSFHEMLAYANSKMVNLFEEDDGKRSEKDSSIWDEEFLYQVKNEVDKNFSHEKLDYYEQVAKHVLKDKARQMDEKEDKQRKQFEDQEFEQQTENWFEHHKKEVYTGVTVGGALLTTIGICVSKNTLTALGKAALTTLGVVGLAVGGYLLYKEFSQKE